MIGYTFKVYLSKSKEHFAFGETETASSPLTEKIPGCIVLVSRVKFL